MLCDAPKPSATQSLRTSAQLCKAQFLLASNCITMNPVKAGCHGIEAGSVATNMKDTSFTSMTDYARMDVYMRKRWRLQTHGHIHAHRDDERPRTRNPLAPDILLTPAIHPPRGACPKVRCITQAAINAHNRASGFGASPAGALAHPCPSAAMRRPSRSQASWPALVGRPGASKQVHFSGWG